MAFKLRILAALFCVLCLTNRANACTGLGCSCLVSMGDISYGNYDFLAGNHDVSSSLEVTCSALILGVLFSYTVEAGTGQSNNILSREMSSGAGALSYNLYVDVARTQIWGDGTGGSAVIADSYNLQLLTPVVRSYFIYGRVPGGQIVTPGSYSDTIIVTITF